MEKKFLTSLWVLLLYQLAVVVATPDSHSFVVSSTEPGKEAEGSEQTAVISEVNPQIYSMHISTNITNRFAKTLITSKVRNLHKNASETTFSVILPENAFISAFEMEIGGIIYKAYVKEKEEAKRIYQQAVSRGQSAAHVELSARDSKTFTVSVNIEPESKTIFRLVYEELLQRQVGQYELVVNVNPGQVVQDLSVQVHINESRQLTFVRTPSLRTGNEISKNNDKLDPSAEIEIINSTSATVTFSPDVNKQETFAQHLGGNKENGLSGQFVVQYDVERDPQGGEILVRDGYFVHFFAPTDLQPLPKHVVFVLDHSGSMSGRKIDQLIEAIQNILSELKTADLFNIIRFADQASVWNVTENTFNTVHLQTDNYGQLEPQLKEMNLPEAVEATTDNVEKAKSVVSYKFDMGLTNIIAGLEIGLFLTKRTQEKSPNKYQPMIIFLTDGLPNVGMRSGDQITETVTKLNSGTNRAVIFSLSFGSGADKNFLRKLSSENLGFSRHIYEAADASLQLQDFYKKISSPLLSNVTFSYVDSVKDVTKTQYPIFYEGSEIVIAGRTNDTPNILLRVNGICTTGLKTFNASRADPVDSLERLWAYLTVKQLLKERDTVENKTELTRKALDLALRYSFVTPVSSLVVVKPNKTDDSVDSKSADDAATLERGRSLGGFARSGGGSRFRYSPRGPSQYPSPSSNIVSGRSGHYYHASPSSWGSEGMPGRAYHSRPSGSVSPSRQLYSTTTLRPRPASMRPSAVGPLTARPSTVRPSTNVTTPEWLSNLKQRNENISTPQGSFKLGQSGAVITHPECPKTPANNTGVCTIIFDCPEVFTYLTDINTYLQYFCPLNEYAGVCCPKKKSVQSEP